MTYKDSGENRVKDTTERYIGANTYTDDLG